MLFSLHPLQAPSKFLLAYRIDRTRKRIIVRGSNSRRSSNRGSNRARIVERSPIRRTRRETTCPYLRRYRRRWSRRRCNRPANVPASGRTPGCRPTRLAPARTAWSRDTPGTRAAAAPAWSWRSLPVAPATSTWTWTTAGSLRAGGSIVRRASAQVEARKWFFFFF